MKIKNVIFSQSQDDSAAVHYNTKNKHFVSSLVLGKMYLVKRARETMNIYIHVGAFQPKANVY